MIHNLIGIFRAYPIITAFSSLIGYFSSGNIDLLMLLVALLINDLINAFLKYKICAPLMGNNKWSIFGYGTRPKGAKHCGTFIKPGSNGIPKGSYGMPSGHTQFAGVFSTIGSLKLYNSNYEFYIKVFGYLCFISFISMMAHSRVFIKCHTIQQTIMGGLIGIFIGYKSYKYTLKN